jgi:UDP-N-acetylglucosamine 2-epimerase (non-hydrolysing)
MIYKNILAIYGTRAEEIKLYPFTKYPGFKFLQVNQSKDLHQGLIDYDWICEEWELEGAIWSREPDAVMVQGDTRTAFSAAVYAYENKIPIIHVEAGMRTWDLSDPRPEEGYRQMIDAIADYQFCSTELARVNCGGIYVGQTSIDTLVEFLPDAIEEDFYIVTVHRNEADIPKIIKTLKKMNQDKLVIFAHPNKVGQELKEHFKTQEPLNYTRFVELLARAKGCISDSGGLQEECIFLGKEFISLRDKSERGHGEIYKAGATKKIVDILNG